MKFYISDKLTRTITMLVSCCGKKGDGRRFIHAAMIAALKTAFMKKNTKILITIIIAIVFAIAAGVCAYMMLSPARTTMYLFNGTYRAGTPLSDSMLTPIQADSSVVLAGAKGKAENYFITQKTKDSIIASGDSLKMDVTEGTALMKSMLSIAGGNSIEMSMSPSKIAVSVKIDDITGVTNELSAGSSVNVYITNNGLSYLLFENMRLLEVFKGNNGTLTGATLELTNDQALLLLDATNVQNGKVYLGLVNSGGYQYVNTPDTKEVPTEPETVSVETQQIVETEPETTSSETTTETIPETTTAVESSTP